MSKQETYEPKEKDLQTGNDQVAVSRLVGQLMQQDSSLLMSQAAAEARRLIARGVRNLW